MKFSKQEPSLLASNLPYTENPRSYFIINTKTGKNMIEYNDGEMIMDFCKCGSIQINGKCSNEHCPSKSQERKDWVISGRVMDFKKPVSYEKAADLAKRLNMKRKKT